MLRGKLNGGQPPFSISCVGATEFIRVAMLGFWEWEDSLKVSVNGDKRLWTANLETQSFDDWFNANFGDLVLCDAGDDFQFTNATTADVRVSIKTSATSFNVPSQTLSDNPTFGVNGNTISFCLSAPIQQIISCDGATTVMSFSHISGDWDIYIDDMEIPVISDSIGPAMYQLNNLYQGKLEGSYDGFLYMASTDIIPHRFKFVPQPNSGVSFTPNIDQNPTFIANDDGGFSFCLSAIPECYFEGISIDLDGPDVNFSVSGSDIGPIKVTDPNGIESIFTPASLEVVHLGYVEGFYSISSVNGFDNLKGDAYFKSSLNQLIVPSPTIDSVTRAPNNIVTISGTAKPFSVVTLIPDESNDEPIAYSKVLEGESNFSFILELPVAFSGYIRCRDGNIGSEGTTFNI